MPTATTTGLDPSSLRARVRDWTLIALFAAALGVPAVRTIAAPEQRPPEREWRTPSAFPELEPTIASVAAFPKGFDAWISDHFAFRASLLRLHSLVKVYGFGVSPVEQVAVGRNGWVFLDGDEHRGTARAIRQFSDEELGRWQELLERRQRFLAEHGIRYLVAIAPEKGTIYPEQLPAQWTRVHERTRYDQLVEHMAAHSDVQVLDLRPAMRAAREDGLVYYPMGSHWNEMGAYVAYREIMRRVAQWFPGAEPHPLEEFRIARSNEQGDSWAERLYLEGIMEQECIALRPTWSPRKVEARIDGLKGYNVRIASEVPTELRGVAFRDSFGTSLVPFLAPHFRRLTVFWRPELLPNAVLAEKPMVLIQEFAERELMMWPWRYEYEWTEGGADAAQAAGLAGVRKEGLVGEVRE